MLRASRSREPTSFQGDLFRSVAFRYFHPDDVISGEGTRLHGGRFVPVGVRAVFASLEEETALREVTTRKSALGGRSQIQCRGVSTDDLCPLGGDESKS